MLDPIIAFFQRVFAAIGRGIGMVVAWLLWPFLAAHGWYRERSWIIRGPILAILVLLVIFYGQFIYRTQIWHGFDPAFVQAYKFDERTVPAGNPLPGEANRCQDSAVVAISAALTDQNVNQNAWVSSTAWRPMMTPLACSITARLAIACSICAASSRAPSSSRTAPTASAAREAARRTSTRSVSSNAYRVFP